MKSGHLTLLLAIIFIVVIFSGNFVFLLNNNQFYISESNRLGTNTTASLNVVNFVNSKASLTLDFTPEEASHLEDVRSLLTTIKRIYYVALLLLVTSLVYLAITKQFNQITPTALVRSGGISLLILTLLFILSLNFNSFFAFIHKPFFDPGTWIFSRESLIITLFPQQFFQDFSFNLFRLIFFNSAVFFGIGLFIRKKFKKQKNSSLNDTS